jgi:dTDP-glucose 4,6-dehydratase
MLNGESLSDSKILITGSTGMVGSFLTESIASLLTNQNVTGWEITAASHRGDFSNLKGVLRDPRVKSISNISSNSSSYAGFDFVFHLASPGSPTKFGTLEEMNEVNSGLLESFFQGKRKPKKVFYVSSGEVYGSQAPPGVVEDFVGIIDPSFERSSYPISKLAAESRLLALGAKHQTEVSVARLFHTFGPGLRPNDGRSFGDFLEKASNGHAPMLKSSGSDTRSILYSMDAVAAFLMIFLRDPQVNNENVFNVGSEIPITIADFARSVSRICGVNPPEFENKNSGDASSFELSPNSVILPNVSRLKALGWEPEFDTDYAIRRTFEWIKQAR